MVCIKIIKTFWKILYSILDSFTALFSHRIQSHSLLSHNASCFRSFLPHYTILGIQISSRVSCLNSLPVISHVLSGLLIQIQKTHYRHVKCDTEFYSVKSSFYVKTLSNWRLGLTNMFNLCDKKWELLGFFRVLQLLHELVLH